VTWRDPETRKQHWKSFAKKRDAEDFREKVSQEIRGGTYVRPQSIPFQKYAEDWLARKQPTVTPNAHQVHRWATVGYLIPEFGLMSLQGIRPDRIERFQAKLLNRGNLSPRSVQIVRQTLASILKDARKKRYLQANPMDGVDSISVPKRELRCMTRPEQLLEFFRLCGPKYGLLYAVEAFCGLRAGEALALQAGDIDWEAGRAHIQRQVIWLRRMDLKPGETSWRFTPPKSKAGNRVVEIPTPILLALRRYLAERSGDTTPETLLFCTRDGTPLQQRNVRRRHFQPALKAIGLTDIRPHDFRRSFVALHVAIGTHPKLVQTRLGHSSIGLTMDVYGRLAGDIDLGAEQTTKWNNLASRALPPAGPAETC
jgi:integrase